MTLNFGLRHTYSCFLECLPGTVHPSTWKVSLDKQIFLGSSRLVLAFSVFARKFEKELRVLRREFEEQQIAMGKALALSGLNNASPTEEKEAVHSKDLSSDSVNIAADVGVAKSEADSSNSDDDHDPELPKSGVPRLMPVAGEVEELLGKVENPNEPNTVK